MDDFTEREARMAKDPEFDLATAHKRFSVDCFNKTWELIDKEGRTPEENEKMLLLSMASTWHWTQREDCEPTNLSVGYWQISRVHAILGRADEARRYGTLCLEASCGEGIAPFYLGYAHEALARAEKVAGNRNEMEEHLGEARKAAERMTDADAKKMLLDDLATIA
jgi:hypothetical protein